MLFYLLNSTRQVLQALVLPHFDYCSVVWSGATKREIEIGSEKGSTAGPWMYTELTFIILTSISPDSMWRRDWHHHYLYLWEVLTCWIHRAVCLNYCLTARTPMQAPQDMPRGLFTVHKSRTDYGRRTVLHRATTTWNSIPHQVTDANSMIRLKNMEKYALCNSGDCEETHTKVQTHAYAHRRLNTHSTHTYIVIFLNGGIIHVVL